MPKRLAITISGAVSLGSYEAGVLYEVLDALRQHNTDPATHDDEKIFVDVLTGASAGGMTAVIAAQKLLYEADSLDLPYKNSFYLPWVADVSIDGLLNFHPGEEKTQSLFSSRYIEQIADRHITLRYQAAGILPREQHPAAADTIQLGLTLTNLNGVDYCRKVRGSDCFTYTRHQDELRIALDAHDVAHDCFDKWQPLRDAAISCGAFPLAFRVKELIRTRVDYPSAFLAPFVPLVQRFTYTDGGVFQNEPLGMAKDFVDRVDKHRENDSRFYLFVAPGAKSGSRETRFNAGNASVFRTAMRLAGAVFTQSRFHDWIFAEEVNEKVRLFDRKALALHADLKAPPGQPNHIDDNALRPAADALLNALFRPSPDGTPLKETRGAAWSRLRHQYDAEYHDLATVQSQGAADVWIDSILAFETAAELGQRDEMAIYGIVATEDELASEKLFSFGGFFDRRLRDYDYNVGRQKAQEWLLAHRTAQAGEIGPIRFTPRALPALPNLGGMEISDLPEGSRKQLRERILDRASDMLRDSNLVPDQLVGPIRILVLRPWLNKQLAL